MHWSPQEQSVAAESFAPQPREPPEPPQTRPVLPQAVPVVEQPEPQLEDSEHDDLQYPPTQRRLAQSEPLVQIIPSVRGHSVSPVQSPPVQAPLEHWLAQEQTSPLESGRAQVFPTPPQIFPLLPQAVPSVEQEYPQLEEAVQDATQVPSAQMPLMQLFPDVQSYPFEALHIPAVQV